jgi:hypothetical protein
VCDQPVEGVALIDGDLRPVVLREGIMVLALDHVA